MSTSGKSSGVVALEVLQRQLLAVVSTTQGSSRVDDDEGRADLPMKLVVGDARGSDAERLAVYREARERRLHEALAQTYACVRRYLGALRFGELAAAYLGAHPPSTPLLRQVGAGMADYLASQPVQPAWLADLARLEWSRAEVQQERDEPRRSLQQLRTLSAEHLGELVLRRVAASRLLRIDRPAANAATMSSTGAALDLDVAASLPVNVVVWRYGDALFERQLDRDEAWWLEAVGRPTPLSSLCGEWAKVLGSCDRSDDWVHDLLVTWIERGLFVDLEA